LDANSLQSGSVLDAIQHSHVMYSRQGQLAEVLVKMKFKTGRITVAPSLFLPMSFAEVPEKVRGLESALATL